MLFWLGVARSAPSGAARKGIHGRQKSSVERPGFFYASAPASAAAFSRSRWAGCKPLHPHPVPLLLPRGDKPAFVNSEIFFLGSETCFFDTRFSVDVGSPFQPRPPPNATKPVLFCCVRTSRKKWAEVRLFRTPALTARPCPVGARLRYRAHSQQNTGCCFVGLSDPCASFLCSAFLT